MRTSILLSVILYFIWLNPTMGTAESLIRSSSLRVSETVTGNTTRIDYVDDYGRITFAADKHYATLIKTRIDNKVYEVYLDDFGNPVKQAMGYYSLCREYDTDDRNRAVIFLDEQGLPMITTNGYAMIVRSFYENGNIKMELYYNTDGMPVNTKYYGYGCIKEYDSLDRIITRTFIDIEGEPFVTLLGYATLKIYYDDRNTGIMSYDEFYYSEKNTPISLSKGQYGVHKECDELGREWLLTYLDADGMPMKTVDGYTTIRKSFNEDDSINNEMYFDINNNPIGLSEGQYGIMYRDGKTYYLDINGNELFNIKRTLYNNSFLVYFSCITIIAISAVVNKKANLLILFIYLFGILYLTILFRSSVTSRISLGDGFVRVLNDKIALRGIVNNFLLFVPMGAILYRIRPKKTLLIIPIALSITIEAIQYLTKTGQCELEDVICNSFGGIVGYLLSSIIEMIQGRTNK